PFVACSGRQGARRDLLHQRHGLARGESARRQADDRSGRIEIVQADQRRADRGDDVHQRAERDHVAVPVPPGAVLNVLEPKAVLRISLRVDLEDPAELVELIDVGRAEIVPSAENTWSSETLTFCVFTRSTSTWYCGTVERKVANTR